MTNACQYGTTNCIFAGKEHDEECCFNGIWRHTYICQECGHTQDATFYSTSTKPDGTYLPPAFMSKDCPKCKTPVAMT